MSRDTFFLAEAISAQDPEQRCNLDLYGSTPHPPHAWAELTTPAPVGLVTALNRPQPPTLTGWRCPGRDPYAYPTIKLTDDDRRRVADELLKGVEERWRASVQESFIGRLKPSRFPYDLIDPSTIKAYWPEEPTT